MAEYGPNSGIVPFTGFTPTLGITGSVIPEVSGRVSFNGMTQQDRELSHFMRNNNNRVARRLLNVLIGAVAGTTATETRTQVTAAQEMTAELQGGGIRPVAAINLINRASTSADITNLKAMLQRTVAPASYATDVAGIGSQSGRAGW